MDEKKKTTQNKSGPLRPEEERATAAECTVCFIWFITGGEKKKPLGLVQLHLETWSVSSISSDGRYSSFWPVEVGLLREMWCQVHPSLMAVATKELSR